MTARDVAGLGALVVGGLAWMLALAADQDDTIGRWGPAAVAGTAWGCALAWLTT